MPPLTRQENPMHLRNLCFACGCIAMVACGSIQGDLLTARDAGGPSLPGTGGNDDASIDDASIDAVSAMDSPSPPEATSVVCPTGPTDPVVLAGPSVQSTGIAAFRSLAVDATHVYFAGELARNASGL